MVQPLPMPLDKYDVFFARFVREAYGRTYDERSYTSSLLDQDSKFSLASLYHNHGIRYVQGHSLGRPRESIGRLTKEEMQKIRDLLGQPAREP